ncbi:hypothetical protein PV410_43080 [Streptomyces sp. PA03-5A]|nr:hypothetical protein [Streptomyces sp. PA03-5A]
MTRIDEILSRALLARDRTVPRDIVPRPAPAAGHAEAQPGTDAPLNPAARDLRALCETLVTHTPASTVADFITDQVPEPRSALVLACVLQLTDTDDGARFWWQYAAGAGQAIAAYCLYLHHLALGERTTADWWHRQTDDVQPPPNPPARKPNPAPRTAGAWNPAQHQIAHSPATTIMELLRDLAHATSRPRTAVVTELMAYVPTAVASGYLRQPETELPMPGPGFARRIRLLLAEAGSRIDLETVSAEPREKAEPVNQRAAETEQPQIEEAAKR